MSFLLINVPESRRKVSCNMKDAVQLKNGSLIMELLVDQLYFRKLSEIPNTNVIQIRRVYFTTEKVQLTVDRIERFFVPTAESPSCALSKPPAYIRAESTPFSPKPTRGLAQYPPRAALPRHRASSSELYSSARPHVGLCLPSSCVRIQLHVQQRGAYRAVQKHTRRGSGRARAREWWGAA